MHFVKAIRSCVRDPSGAKRFVKRWMRSKLWNEEFKEVAHKKMEI